MKIREKTIKENITIHNKNNTMDGGNYNTQYESTVTYFGFLKITHKYNRNVTSSVTEKKEEIGFKK